MATTATSAAPSVVDTKKTAKVVVPLHKRIEGLLDSVFRDVVKDNPLFTDRSLVCLHAAGKKLPSGAQITARRLEELLRWQIDCRRLRVSSFVAIAPRGKYSYRLRLLVGDDRKEVFSCSLRRIPGKPRIVLKAGHRYHELAIR